MQIENSYLSEVFVMDREKRIIRTSIIGITANIFLAVAMAGARVHENRE